MIIEAIQIQDFKGIRDLTIIPGQRKLVVLSGKNGAGKSSTIEAIFTALAGGQQKLEAPVRIGADKATIEIKLSNGLTVRKIITSQGKPALEVINDQGAIFQKPQSILDSFGGKLISPTDFVSASPKQRAEIFKRLTGIDFSQLDADIANQKQEITVLNRLLKEMEAKSKEFADVAEMTAEEPVDLSALMQQQQEQMRALEAYRTLSTEATNLQIEYAAIMDRARYIESRLKEIEATEPPVTVDFSEQIAEATATNARIEKHSRLTQLRKDYSQTKHQLIKAQGIVSQLEGQKETSLANAKLPLPGLGLSDDNVTYKGVPFEGLSSGEQLRVSLAMAIAIRGELDVMLLPNASLLDDESLELVRQTAEEAGIQLWAEVVGDYDGESIKIVDGEALYGQVGAGNTQKRNDNSPFANA